MTKKIENKYSIWIKLISIIIPLVVAILFTIKIEYTLPVFLPPIYSTINALTFVLLIISYIAIRKRKIKIHENLMKICIGLSLLFFSDVHVLSHHIKLNNIWGYKQRWNKRFLREASK